MSQSNSSGSVRLKNRLVRLGMASLLIGLVTAIGAGAAVAPGFGAGESPFLSGTEDGLNRGVIDHQALRYCESGDCDEASMVRLPESRGSYTLGADGEAYTVAYVNGVASLFSFNASTPAEDGTFTAVKRGALPSGITEIAIDPSNGKLFGLRVTNGQRVLVELESSTASLVTEVGDVEKVDGTPVTDGSEIAFDDEGKLFLLDGASRRLSELDKTTARSFDDAVSDKVTSTDKAGLQPISLTDLITNCTEVFSANEQDTDSTPGNGNPSEDDYDCITITRDTPKIDLSLQKDVDNSTPDINGTVVFTISVLNSGPQPATGVSVSDLLPVGLIYQSDDGGGAFNSGSGIWTIGDLAVNQTVMLNITAQVTRTGVTENCAEVASADQQDIDSVPANGSPSEDDRDCARVTVDEPQIDLELEKTVDDPNPVLDGFVTFTIQVTNQGPDGATGVEVGDILPVGLEYVTDNGGGAFNPATGIWTIGNIPAGENRTLDIMVKVTNTGVLQNCAEVVAADQADPDSVPGNGNPNEDDYDCERVSVDLPMIDLALTKDVDNSNPALNGTVIFTLTVVNESSENATGVEVGDLLPPGLVYQSSTGDGSYNPVTGVWDIGSLLAGQTKTHNIEVVVTNTNVLTNCAEIIGADQADIDSTPGNGNPNEDDYDCEPVTPEQPTADLSLVKDVDNSMPDLNGTVKFTITVTNNGPQDAPGVKVGDILPPGLVYQSSMASLGSYNAATGIWDVGTIAASNSQTLMITVLATNTNVMTNCAEVVESGVADPDSTPGNEEPSEDDWSCATVSPDQPIIDLELDKTVDNPSPDIFGNVTYTVTVSNVSTENATGVQVGDILPGGVTYVSSSASQGSYNNVNGIWNVGALNAGQSQTLDITVTVVNTEVSTNCAEITLADQSDVDSTPGNNNPNEDDFACVSVSPNQPMIDLSLVKTVDNATPALNGNVVFTIAVTNSGPDDAHDVEVGDLLPPGLAYVSDNSGGSYNAGTGIWTIGTVAVNGTVTLQVTAKAVTTNPATNCAEVTNAAETDVDSTPGNGNFNEDDNDCVTISPDQPTADLSLVKDVDNSMPDLNGTVKFTITVTNNGPEDAPGVKVGDILPPGLVYQSSMASSGSYNPATGIWDVGTIADSNTETLMITVLATNTNVMTNCAEVVESGIADPDSTPGNEEPSEDDWSCATVSPDQPIIDLELDKTVDNPSPDIFGNVTYTVTVSNVSTENATGVQVGDILPGGVNYVSSSASQGSYNNVNGIWNVGALNAGQSRTLNITVTVVNTEVSTNCAEITLADQSDVDSTPGNNNPNEDDFACVSVSPNQPMIDLSLVKSVDNATPGLNEDFNFVIEVSNAGPDDAHDVEVGDLLPPGLVYVSDTSGGAYNPATGIWQIGTIPATAGVALQITVKAVTTNPATNCAEVTNAAETDVDSTPGNGNYNEDDNDCVTVSPEQPTIDLSLTKVVDNPSPALNGQVEFTITVTNSGPEDATAVQVGDILPPGLVYTGDTPSQGAYNLGNGIWTVGALPAGGTAMLRIRANATNTNVMTNCAEIVNAGEADADSTPGNENPQEDDFGCATVSPEQPTADLSLTKAVDNPSPALNGTVIFTVTVTNNGPATAGDVQVGDLLPPGLVYQFATQSQGSYNNGTGIWNVGSLASGVSATLNITVQATRTEVMTNCAEVVNSNQADPDSTPGNENPQEDDYACAKVGPEQPMSDLSLTKVVNSATPAYGDQITFTIELTNRGPNVAENIQVADLLPPGLTYLSSNASLGSYNASTGIWTVGTMGVNGVQTLQVTVLVEGTDAMTNCAEVVNQSTADPDSTPGNGNPNEDDRDCETVRPTQDLADLSMVKSVSNPAPSFGGFVTWTMVVTNNGPSNATNVRLSDNLPPGLLYTTHNASAGSFNVGTGEWIIPNLAANGMATLTITTQVSGTDAMTNCIEITNADQADPDSTPGNGNPAEDDRACATISPDQPTADLRLTKVVDVSNPAVGGVVNYTIEVSNTGPSTAVNVVVGDLLPPGLNFQNASATQGSYDPGTGLWTVGNIAANGNARLTIAVVVNTANPVTNCAEVLDADTADPDSTPGNENPNEDDRGCATVSPNTQTADVRLIKRANNMMPDVGADVVFTITVTNDGPNTANNVIVGDILPEGLEYVTHSGGTYNPATGLWTVGNIAAGNSRQILIQATMTSTEALTNCAEVVNMGTADPDSTPGNGNPNEDDYSCVVITPRTPGADLSLDKGVVVNPNPTVGDEVVFALTVTNSGPDAATNVLVADVLPVGLNFVGFDGPVQGVPSYNGTTRSISWQLANVSDGGQATLLVRAVMASASPLTNCAEIMLSDQPDLDSTPGNGVETEDDHDCATLFPEENVADLSLDKAITNNPNPQVGAPVEFRLTVTNDGPNTATDVLVADALPVGMEYVGFNGASAGTPNFNPGNRTIQWTIPSLNSGATATLTFTAIANTASPLTNCAEIMAVNEPDPDSTPGNDVSTEDDSDCVTTYPEEAVADLRLNKVIIDNPNPQVGEVVQFRLTVFNDGPNAATDVEVSDMLPVGMEYAGFALTDPNAGTPTYYPATRSIIWTIPSIAPNSSASIFLEVNHNVLNALKNCAEVTASNEADPDSTPGNGVPSEDDFNCDTVRPVATIADLSVEKTVDNATPKVGDAVNFTIVIRNAGPDAATNVTMSDVLPVGLEYITYASSEGNYDSATGIFSVPSIAAGGTATLLLAAQVNTTNVLKNCAEIQAVDQPDPDSFMGNGVPEEDDFDCAQVSPVPSIADLSVTKLVNNALPSLGEEVEWVVTVTNSGPDPATGVQVGDLLNPNLGYVSDTSGGDYTPGTGIWNVGGLAVGESQTLRIVTTVNSSDTIVNNAEVVNSDQTDPDSTPGNGLPEEDDYASARVTGVEEVSDLTLSKSVNNGMPLVGDQVTFTIDVLNEGPAAATGVTVSDQIPAGMSFVSSNTSVGSYNSATGVWTVGNIAVGDTETLEITVTVNTTGTLVNTAEVTGMDQIDSDSTPGNGNPNEDDIGMAQVTTDQDVADLSLTKTVSDASPQLGEQVTFSIVLRNAGPEVATNIQVTDVVPAGMSYVSNSATVGSYDSNTGIWSVPALGVGGTVTLSLTVTVNTTGTLVNVAEVTKVDQIDPDSTPGNGNPNEDDMGMAQVTIGQDVADLSVTKTVSDSTPTQGDTVVFTILVENAGPDFATNVQVTDVLPDGMTFVSAAAGQGSYDPISGIWFVGTLGTPPVPNVPSINPSAALLDITATVDATGVFVNRAEVTGVDQFDPDSTPGNGNPDEDDMGQAQLSVGQDVADLSVTKSVDLANPVQGDYVVFTILVNNAGPDIATGVELTDVLPVGMNFFDSSASQGGYNPVTGVWDVGTLGVNNTASLQIAAWVNTTGTFVNVAEITKVDQFDPDSTPGNGNPSEDDMGMAQVSTEQAVVDLSVSKIVNNPTPTEGQNVIFTIAVQNAGPNAATGVQVTDVLPVGMAYVSATSSQGSYNSANGVWNVGNLVSGDAATLMITARVNTQGTFVNTAEVTKADQIDIDSTPGNGNPSEDDMGMARVSTQQDIADLSVTKSVNDAFPTQGDNVIFTITVANAGPDAATGVEVTDVLPVGMTYVSASASQGSFNSSSGNWNVGTVGVSESATLQITATVNAQGTFLNVAEVTKANQIDVDSAPGNGNPNEDDMGMVRISTQQEIVDLSVSKSVDNGAPTQGENVVFTIIVANSGPGIATGVEVTDVLPIGMSFVSASASAGTYNFSDGTWNVGTLGVSNSATLLVTANVATTGTFVNVAEVTKVNQIDVDSTPGNGNPSEDDMGMARVSTNQPVIDLSVSKIVNNARPTEGQNVVFTIVVSNAGPDAASGVEVTDVLPAGMSYVSATASTGSYNTGDGAWNVGNLGVGATATLQITARVNAPGTFVNTAEVTKADQIDIDSTPGNGNPSEDDMGMARVSTQQDIADLSVTKTVNDSFPTQGDNVIFTIRVENAGPDIATGVEVTDVLPVGSSYVSATASQGSYNSASGAWAVGTIGVDGAAVLQLTATVNTTGTFVNVAEVTKVDQIDIDSTPGNGNPNEDDMGMARISTEQEVIDLSVTKSVNNGAPTQGENVVFTITVANAGPAIATGVEVTDILPVGMDFVSAATSTGAYNNATGLWNVGTLGIGQTATMQVTAQVVTSGTFVNVAEVTKANQIDIDSTPGNGNPSEDDMGMAQVSTQQKVIDLRVTKIVNDPTPTQGQNVVFTIALSNGGPDIATGVQVTDVLPVGMSYVSATASQGSYNSANGVWNVGTVGVAGSATLQLTARVNTTGTFVNVAEVTKADQIDIDSTPGNGNPGEDDMGMARVSTEQKIIDLNVTKSVNNAAPTQGDNIVFTVMVMNSGPDIASGVQVTDVLPVGMDFVSATASQGSYNSGNGGWTVGTVGVGGVATLQVTATVVTTGTFVNVAEVTKANEIDVDSTPGNGNPSEDDMGMVRVSTEQDIADLSVTKVVNNDSPTEGDTVVFTITVTNGGPDIATGVMVTDVLPVGIGFVSASSSQGNYNSGNGVWTVGTLGNSQTATLQITSTVNTTGTFVNVAEVTKVDQIDPDSTPGNGNPDEDDMGMVQITTRQDISDMSVTKTVNNAQPTQGDQVVFTVTVANAGPSIATGVKVTDNLPVGMGFVSATTSQGTYNSGTGIWDVGTMGNGQTATLQVTATVNTTGTFVNVAEVTKVDQIDPDSTPGNGNPSEDDMGMAQVTTDQDISDLSVTKSVNNPAPTQGDNIVFTVTVRNNGPDRATGVKVTDQLPVGMEFVSVTTSQGSYDSVTGIWEVGSLNLAAEATMQMTARVNTTGTFVNVAEVTKVDQIDPDSTPGNGNPNEDDMGMSQVSTNQDVSDISVTKSVDNATPTEGGVITFTITATNHGPDIATGLKVTDVLSETLGFVSSTATSGSYDASTGIWNIGTLGVTQTATLQIRAQVNAPGTFINMAEVTKVDQIDPDSTPGNGNPDEDDTGMVQITTRQDVADLSVTKSVDRLELSVGENAVFSIVVTNHGPAVATGVKVTDVLPDIFEYVSSASTQGLYTSADGLWNVGTLGVGASATLTITARATAEGVVVNAAEVVKSDQIDPDSTPGNGNPNEDDMGMTPPIVIDNGRIDLSVVKSVNTGQTQVGQNVVFTVTVSNAGPNTATGVAVGEALPAGLQYIAATTTQGGYNVANGVWNVGTLGVGSSATLQLTARTTTTGVFVNIAEVIAANEPDIDSVPNNHVPEEDDQDHAHVNVEGGIIDLSLVKTVNTPQAQVGQNVVFSITVSNAGPQSATGVAVADVLPAGLGYVSSTSTQGGFNVANGVWSVGGLAVGSSATLNITAQATAQGTFTNVAEVVAADQQDIDSIPNNHNPNEDDQGAASVYVNVQQQYIDLSLNKTVNVSQAFVGQNVVFTIRVANSGPITATGVAVADVLPAGLGYVAHGTSTGSFNPATGVWTVGSLATGGFATLNISAKVNNAGVFVNVAEVVAANQPDVDSTPGNGNPAEDDYGSAVVTGTQQHTYIDLSLVKSVNVPTAPVGGNVVFTISVANTSQATATGVAVADVLPQGMGFVSSQASQGAFTVQNGIWTVGTVAPGASAMLYITARVNTQGMFVNVAEVVAANQPDVDSTPGNGNPNEDDYGTARVTSQHIPGDHADLAVTKVADNPTPLVGDIVTYTITASNLGPATATGVSVTDVLPAGLQFYSIGTTATLGYYNPVTGVWGIGTLAPGASATLYLSVIVDALGNHYNAIVNEVWIDGDQYDPNHYNNHDSEPISPRQCSTGGNGGIESNGSMVIDLMSALFETETLSDRTDMYAAAFTSARNPNGAIAANQFMRRAEGPLAVDAKETTEKSSRLSAFVPASGPQGTAGVVSSPTWIIAPTNATEVYSMDYVHGTDYRIAAILAISSGAELYDHTKQVCDRLGGSSLQGLQTMAVDGNQYVLTHTVSPDGTIDYAINFKAYRTSAGYTVDSRFSLTEYQVPAGTSEVLNFQVWGTAPDFAAELTKDVLDRLSGQGTLSFNNATTEIPDVFVRSGRYDKGELILEVVNNAGASSVSLEGFAARTETEAYTGTSRPVAWSVSLDPSVAVEEVRIPVENIYDASLLMRNSVDGEVDQLYFADGAWGYNDNGGAGTINTFSVAPQSPFVAQDDFVLLERGARLTGMTPGTPSDDFVSMFRFARPGRQVLDLTKPEYASVAQQLVFTASGSGTVEVQLIKRGITTWDQFRYTVTLQPTPRTYAIDFAQFKNSAGGWFTAEDIEMVAFFVVGNRSNPMPFDVTINDLAFGAYRSIVSNEGETEIPTEIALNQNYPNPFNPTTTISFDLPQSAQVQLRVFDVLGREVAELANDQFNAGIHRVNFDATGLTSGTYIYHLKVGDRTFTQKMILMK